MTRRRKRPLNNGRSTARNVPPFPQEFRLKVARLYVEDGYPAKLIASQFGISDYSVYTWGKKYREQGEQGLVDRPKTASGSTKLPEAVSQSIVDLKKENPGYGARRIRDILKRFFLVGTSESTVQRTLLTLGKIERFWQSILSEFLQLDPGRPVAEPGHGGDDRRLVAEKKEDPKQLNPRLQQLIDRNTQGGNLVKLEKRLKQIQNKANA